MNHETTPAPTSGDGRTAPVTSLAVGNLTPPPELDDEGHQVLGARLAGGLYLLILLAGMPFLLAGDSTSTALASPFALIMDAVVSIALLRGNLKIRGFAIFRLVLGTLIYGAISISTGAATEVFIQLVILTFMLLLLVGVPRPRRRRIAVALASSVVLMTLVATLVEHTDLRPSVVNGELLPIEGGDLRGLDIAYSLTVPAGFQRRETAVARTENPRIDTWVVDNRRDMHVMTVCADIGGVVDEELYVTSIINEVASHGRTLHARTQPPGVEQHRLARLEARGDVPFLVDVNTRGNQACIVYAFGPRAAFSANTTQLLAILDSFRFTSPQVSGKLLPIPGSVLGRQGAWHYRPPAGFQRRAHEAYAETNDDVDQWVIDPILDQHIITRCERASADHVFDPGAFFSDIVTGTTDEGDTVEIITKASPTSSRGRARMTSAQYISIIDTMVNDDVGCWTVAVVQRRQAASLPAILSGLDSFAFGPPQ